MTARALVDTRTIRTALFDMDGVVTDTTSMHERAWKETFDRLLRQRAETSEERDGFRPPSADTHQEPQGAGRFSPFTHEEYIRSVDGRSRRDGVRAFLASRNITLPEDAVHGTYSVRSVADAKNDRFLELLRAHGATSFRDTRDFIHRLHATGITTAVFTASRNATQVLESANIADVFAVCVDGTVAADLCLPGKPDPAMLLEAARRLGSGPNHTVVFEDAIAGVAAGRAGEFGLVIGVDRSGGTVDLGAYGADAVISSFDEVALIESPPEGVRPIADVPPVLPQWDALTRCVLRGNRLAVFLDYDGTLTPIVNRPEDAVLGPDMRDRLEQLAAHCFVAIISGRDASFIREQVGLDTVIYLGSHGFDVVGPHGKAPSLPSFDRFLPALNEAETGLRRGLVEFRGVTIERKRFAIAIHYRNTSIDLMPHIKVAVEHEAALHECLRMTGGKMVFELRPAVEWGKGQALRWALDTFVGEAGAALYSVVPVFVGDDLTDEDAFHELAPDGLTIVVSPGETRETAALFRVVDTEEVGQVLQRLSDYCERTASGV